MIEIKNNSVILSIGKNKKYDLPFLWIRDNCQCDSCRITETQEKQFLLHTVPIDLSPKIVKEIEGNIFIIWSDGHETKIPVKMIEQSSDSRYPSKSEWPLNFKPETYDWQRFLDKNETAISALKTFVGRAHV